MIIQNVECSLNGMVTVKCVRARVCGRQSGGRGMRFTYSDIFLCILYKHFQSHQFLQFLSNWIFLLLSLLSVFLQCPLCTKSCSSSLPVDWPFFFMFCAAFLCLWDTLSVSHLWSSCCLFPLRLPFVWATFPC